MISKSCSVCKETKLLEMFSKQSSNKSGYRSQCKSCISQKQKNNYEKLSKYYKEYRAANKEKVAETKRNYRKNNKEKIQQMEKNHREANKEKIAEYQKGYRAKTVEQRKEYKKRYSAENKEALKISAKKYRENNPLVIKKNNLERRVRKLSNGVFQISKKEIQRLYNSPCFYCGQEESIQIDHIIPISRGGRHSIGNLIPACAKCNLNKRDKLLVEWINK